MLTALAIKRVHNLPPHLSYASTLPRLTTVQDIQDYASRIFWYTV